MSAPLLGRCPSCKKTLRLPAGAVGKTVRCLQCGMVSEARPTPKLQARQEAAKAPPPPAVVPTVAAVVAAPPVPAPVPTRATAIAAQSPFAFQAIAQPANAWSAIAAAEAAEPVITPSRRYRKGGGWLVTVFALFFLVACLGGTAAAVYFLMPRIKEKINEQPSAKTPEGTTPAVAAGNQDQAVVTDGGPKFPRRLLGISVNNYIYANPTSYGLDPSKRIRRDFGKTLEKLANKLRIPDTQVFEISDGAPGKQRHTPLKPIIEQTLTRFTESSRPQDRVIVVLCAHTVVVGGKPYLVPLEGELNDAKTLIPLEWVMQQLEKCPAQQKVLIADFNRYDRGRGKERPHGGKLAASTEKLLKNPPPGVQVWSASSAGEYSYESDDDYVFAPKSGDAQAMKGGAFLCMFSVAFLEGVSFGIQKPSDPLPLEALAKPVNAYTVDFAQELDDPDGEAADTEEKGKDEKKPAAAPAKRKALQTPFLAGAPKGESIAFDAAAPLAAPVSIPTPQDVFGKDIVTRDQIKKTMDLFSLPPIKEARKTDADVRFDEVLPFRTAALADYRNTTTPEQVKADPEKYPLRAAVVEAIEKLRQIDAGGIALPTELREAALNDAAKNDLKKLQRGPAKVQQQLESIAELLQKVAEDRSGEKSKFWQATFDYVQAQVKARYVYVYEYNSVAGQVRKDSLPPLDKTKKQQVGWRLASKESLSTTEGEVKDMRKDARKIYVKLAKDHPGTPWAVLAKREADAALGLRWEPFAESKGEQREAAPEKR